MVERMSLVTIMGMLEDAEYAVKSLIKTGIVNPVSSELGLKVIRSLYNVNWGLPTDILTDTFTRLAPGLDLEATSHQLNTLFSKLKIQMDLQSNPQPSTEHRENLEKEVNRLFEAFFTLNEKVDDLHLQIETLRRFSSLGLLEDVSFDLSKLQALEHFDVQLGTMAYEYQVRMDLNYENIDALVFKAAYLNGQQVYLFITPRAKRKETDALLRSMYFEPIEILWAYMDYPKAMISKVQEKMTALRVELSACEKEMHLYKVKNQAALEEAMMHLSLENTIESMRGLILQNGRYFLFTGWVPQEDLEVLRATITAQMKTPYLVCHEDKIVKGAIVPTKLRNNWFVKPFETLVNLYGTPNYNELDPTSFVAIAYMVLFGAMFGDIGQGFIFWISGRILEKTRKHKAVGGVLSRIGMSSIVFGTLYDSIFGIEHLISGMLIFFFGENWGPYNLRTLFLSPLEHTNLILILSIVLGIILILASFLMSIINKMRQNRLVEGLFGRNGVNGLVLFTGLILLGVLLYLGSPSWSIRLSTMLIAISMLILVFKEPIGHKFIHKIPLYSEDQQGSLVESGFELFETLLSMLSNGISFIRVGAFALNHAGLFIAFHTMAAMSTSHLGDFTLFILGNLVVIALEGLIVFIQGLRLIYYELFSKYFAGDGLPFVGVTVGMRVDKQGK